MPRWPWKNTIFYVVKKGQNGPFLDHFQKICLKVVTKLGWECQFLLKLSPRDVGRWIKRLDSKAFNISWSYERPKIVKFAQKYHDFHIFGQIWQSLKAHMAHCYWKLLNLTSWSTYLHLLGTTSAKIGIPNPIWWPLWHKFCKNGQKMGHFGPFLLHKRWCSFKATEA